MSLGIAFPGGVEAARSRITMIGGVGTHRVRFHYERLGSGTGVSQPWSGCGIATGSVSIRSNWGQRVDAKWCAGWFNT